MKRLKNILAVSAVLMGLSLTEQVMARCSFPGNSPYAPVLPFTIPPLDVSGPIGTELYSTILQTSAPPYVLECDSGIGRVSNVSHYTHLGGGVYDTGIPGIGFTYADVFTGLPNGMPNNHNFGTLTRYTYSTLNGYFKLIKTGPMTTGGSIKVGNLIQSASIDHNHSIHTVYFATPVPIVLAIPTCAATTATVNVDLGNVSLQDLAVTGRSPPKNFDIGLLCSGGDGTATIDVHVTLTDQSNTSNRSTELSLTPGSTATGVALEINNKNGLVSFGADSDAPGNPGQWFEGTANNGAFTIPLSANYVKTATNPKPGSANAVATYTISYQ